MVEREKGGVKLFVGRLPREVTQKQLRECFEEFGEVLEVFVIDSQAMSNVGCSFIRMATVEQAELVIQELHEQRVLIPDQRDLGPMQVAFAKGEAIRLGLDEKEEILPSFKEARMKVVEHQEKRMFFEAIQKQQEAQHQAMMQQQQLQQQAANAGMLPTPELIALIKDGQRFGGPVFKQKWRSYCDQGWAGIYDYDPSHHPHETLAQFVTMAAYDHGQEPWFRSRFNGLPLPPSKMPARPPFGPPPCMGPRGMLPPPFGPPGMGPLGMPQLLPPCGLPGGLPPFLDQGPGQLAEAPGNGDAPSVEAEGGGCPTMGNSALLIPDPRKLQDYTDVDAISAGSDIGNIEDINNDDI